LSFRLSFFFLQQKNKPTLTPENLYLQHTHTNENGIKIWKKYSLTIEELKGTI